MPMASVKGMPKRVRREVWTSESTLHSGAGLSGLLTGRDGSWRKFSVSEMVRSRHGVDDNNEGGRGGFETQRSVSLQKVPMLREGRLLLASTQEWRNGMCGEATLQL